MGVSSVFDESLQITPRGEARASRHRWGLVVCIVLAVSPFSLAGAPASGAPGPGPTSCTPGWTVVAQQDDSFTWTEPLPGLRAVSWAGTAQLLENLDANCYVLGIRIRYTGPVNGGTLTITRNPFVSYTVQYPSPFTNYGNVGVNAYGNLVTWNPAAGTYIGYTVETHFDINTRGADEYFIQGVGLGGVVSGVRVTFGLPMSLLGKTIHAQIHVGLNLCQCSVASFFVPGSAPPLFDFSLAVNPTSGTVTAGGSVTATVTATLVSGTSTAVTFSATGLPAGASASFAPSQCVPTCTTTMTLSTTSSTPSGTYPITVKGTGGGLTRTTGYTLTVQAPFDFSLSVNPTSGTVTAGDSVTASLTATLVSGTSTAVTFDASGLPSGASASFAPSQCVPTCTSTITIATSSSTPSGTYPITVSAMGGGLTRTTGYTLTVQPLPPGFDFILAVDPTSGTVTAGGSVTASVTATLVSGTSTAVTFNTSGLPSGASATFSPSQCVPTCTTTMTLSTDPSTLAGAYTITVKAIGGGLTRTTGYTLTVQPLPPGFDFALSVDPTAGRVTAGGSATASATASLVSGTATAVTFSASGVPLGASATFAPSQCVPTCTSTMTLSTSTSTPNGTFGVTVTASGGGASHSTTYTLTVESAPPAETWDAYVHAHQDDWQLFMSPSTYYDYQRGHHLLFVYVTAGDAGQPSSYWAAREQASEASVQWLIGNNLSGSSAFASICYTDTTVVCHNMWRWSLERTVSIYMRLPDGNSDGNGFPSTGFQALEKLRDGLIPTLSAVDGSATYNGWRDLYLSVAAVIRTYTPYDATTRVNAPDFNRTRQSFEGKTCNGCSDHPDHLAVADAVYNFTIGAGTPWARRFFIDYPLGWADSRYPSNLGSGDYTLKKQLFLRYRDVMMALTGEDVYATQTTFWENIFQREYARTL